MSETILMSKMLKDPNFFSSHELVIGVDDEDKPTYGEKTLTIDRIILEDVTDMELIKTNKKNEQGTQTKKAYVLHFKEPNKPYIVKATVVIEAIEKATGTKVVNRWAGKQITFYVQKNVRAFGKITDALRVRPFAPTVRKTYECEDCHRTDVEEGMMVRTKKAFDAILCKDCGTKRSELKNNEEVKTDEPLPETAAE